MAENLPQRRVLRDAAELDALLEQLRRSKNPDGTPEAEEPAIKKPRLTSTIQTPQAPVIDAQISTPINAVVICNAIVISKEVRDVANHAADQASTAVSANATNHNNALATAIAALREAESKIAASEKAIKEAKVALERDRVEIIRVSEGNGG